MQEHRYQIPDAFSFTYYEEKVNLINQASVQVFQSLNQEHPQNRIIGILTPKNMVPWWKIDPNRGFAHRYLANATGSTPSAQFDARYSDSYQAIYLEIYGEDLKRIKQLGQFCLSRLDRGTGIHLRTGLYGPTGKLSKILFEGKLAQH